MSCLNGKLSEQGLIKTIFNGEDKEYILKTSETYSIGDHKFEVPLGRQVAWALASLKYEIKTQNYQILENSKVLVSVRDGKVTSNNGGELFSEVFNEKTQYTIEEIK